MPENQKWLNSHRELILMRAKIIYAVVAALCVFLPLAQAAPSVWHNSPKTGTDVGETFELRFEIMANETGNYTITIDPGDKFTVVGGNTTITLNIPKEETRTFVFTMQVTQKLEDGKYKITYDALREGMVFKSGIAYVRAGKQAPGFEVAVALSGIAVALILWRRRV